VSLVGLMLSAGALLVSVGGIVQATRAEQKAASAERLIRETQRLPRCTLDEASAKEISLCEADSSRLKCIRSHLGDHDVILAIKRHKPRPNSAGQGPRSWILETNACRLERWLVVSSAPKLKVNWAPESTWKQWK